MKTPIESVLDYKEDCCGCTACYAICPMSAISMVQDSEGFLYPQIDQKTCIGCLQCRKTCPIIKADAEERTPSSAI